MAGKHPDFPDRIKRALIVRIESTDSFDGVAEQVEPVRQFRSHREQVDQAATDGIFTRRHDLRYVVVSGNRQLRLEFFFVERFTLFEIKGVCREKSGRRDAQEGGRGRNEQNVTTSV